MGVATAALVVHTIVIVTNLEQGTFISFDRMHSVDAAPLVHVPLRKYEKNTLNEKKKKQIRRNSSGQLAFVDLGADDDTEA